MLGIDSELKGTILFLVSVAWTVLAVSLRVRAAVLARRADPAMSPLIALGTGWLKSPDAQARRARQLSIVTVVLGLVLLFVLVFVL
jgi:hypothetical protein